MVAFAFGGRLARGHLTEIQRHETSAWSIVVVMEIWRSAEAAERVASNNVSFETCSVAVAAVSSGGGGHCGSAFVQKR